jgi:DNA-binding CsgD family transcriptional regulator
LVHWIHHDGGFDLRSTSYFTEDWLTDYAPLAHSDPWTSYGVAHPKLHNKILLLHEHVPGSVIEHSTIFNEVVRKNGDDTFHGMAMFVSSESGFGALAVHRGKSDSQFDAGDAAQLSSTINHFKNVLLVRGEIASASRKANTARQALDAFALAVIVVRADGRLIHMNAAAETALGRNDGLLCKGGCLTASAVASGARLAEAIARATASRDCTATSFPVARGPGKADYVVTVAPMIADATSSTAIVLFRDPTTTDMSLPHRLRSLFGLSRAEAEIAVEIGQGRSLADIVAARGVSPNTVSAQLKSIMAKMECDRQAQLAARIAALPRLRNT